MTVEIAEAAAGSSLGTLEGCGNGGSPERLTRNCCEYSNVVESPSAQQYTALAVRGRGAAAGAKLNLGAVLLLDRETIYSMHVQYLYDV